MIVKNLLDPEAKQEIITRLNRLTPTSKREWGKMDIAQMLAHCKLPILASMGKHQINAGFVKRLIFPLFKSLLYNEKPYKKGTPTDPSYVQTEPKDFEKEKNELLAIINSFTEESITKLPHPAFGKLTIEQWGKANWKHLDHHLTQFGE